MKKSNKKGFTLVELVVVIAIIGVLAAILVPSMLNYVKKSKLKSANSDAKTAYNAVSGAVADIETQGFSVTSQDTIPSNADLDCTKNKDKETLAEDGSNIQAYLDYVAWAALSENGSDAGHIAYGFSDDVTGIEDSKSLWVQWNKTSQDAITGQYPDAPADVEAAGVISKSFGEFVAKDSQTSAT